MTILETSPLSSEQQAKLREFLQGMDAGQRMWTSGYLAGMGHSPESVSVSANPLTVIYGTESGNAEACAASLHSEMRKAGRQARLVNMADYDVGQLATESEVYAIVSTWGEGDPPESATAFFETIAQPTVAKVPNLKFAVFGLGDSSYADFCECGKILDRRFEELGATRLLARVDADVDFEQPFEEWKRAIVEGLQTSSVAVLDAPKESVPAIEYGKKHPFPAKVLTHVRLSGRNSAKNTCHVELSLDGSGMDYKPGDVVGIFPRNAQPMVDEMLQLTDLDGDVPVTVGEETLSLRDALTAKFDITGLGLPIAKKYAALTGNPELTTALSEENLPTFKEWMVGRELRDLLERFPLRGQSVDAFVGILRKLPPRLYSIASSLKAHPGEVHLTVGAVYYSTHGREREGVCSSYLCDRIGLGETVDLYTHTNKNFFIPDDPQTPIIMVGPGTGIAPFRAFVEERAAIGATGKNWLFFGEQHFNEDFLYQLEWQDYLKQGVLSRMDVAFSRDTESKVYVQHRMLEHAKDIYAWIQEGAYFYVCGDAARMAKDVHAALLQIYRKVGGHSESAAEEAVKALQKDKRYQRDVY